MILRPATPYDAPGLACLWLEMAAERGITDADGDAWHRICFRGLAEHRTIAILAVDGPDYIGFADGQVLYEPATRETRLVGGHLFVKPDYRGDALSQRLMVRLLALAIQSGVSCVLTHGGPSAHAFETLLRKPMDKIHEIRMVKLG